MKKLNEYVVYFNIFKVHNLVKKKKKFLMTYTGISNLFFIF